MKKSKKIGLSLNKKVISNFEQTALKGGGSGITYACRTSACGQTGLSCNPWMCNYK